METETCWMGYMGILQADKITILHGERVTVRCRELGRYKLVGDPLLVCRNGGWSGKSPSCIPTTSISNYSGKKSSFHQHSFVIICRCQITQHSPSGNIITHYSVSQNKCNISFRFILLPKRRIASFSLFLDIQENLSLLIFVMGWLFFCVFLKPAYRI